MTPNSGRRRAQRHFRAKRCETCGAKENLERHHVNENPTDNRPENVMVLCRRHHFIIHQQTRDPHGRFLSKAGTLRSVTTPVYPMEIAP